MDCYSHRSVEDKQFQARIRNLHVLGNGAGLSCGLMVIRQERRVHRAHVGGRNVSFFGKGIVMNKRDAVLSLLDPVHKPGYVPAAFFLHFDPAYHHGELAVIKHLEYFRYTGMDFVKIQYEHRYPHLEEIRQPEDWAKMPYYKPDFYEDPLRVVEGLVKAAKAEALVLLTLYSPFMFAGHVTSDEIVTAHIQENPVAVKRGLETITGSLLEFMKECARLGLDGFYTSTQGGESGRFPDRSLYDECIRPFDLAVMEEANRLCSFNILHVCDYRHPYSDLSPYVNYPGQVVSAPTQLTGGKVSSRQVAELFKRPILGGMDRLGVIASGSHSQVVQAAEEALRDAPERFMLGADCTVPADTSWNNLRVAIATAHNYRQA
jgi:uroporphyrinogen decarboxylase